jgi:hypothetical protein
MICEYQYLKDVLLGPEPEAPEPEEPKKRNSKGKKRLFSKDSDEDSGDDLDDFIVNDDEPEPKRQKIQSEAIEVIDLTGDDDDVVIAGPSVEKIVDPVVAPKPLSPMREGPDCEGKGKEFAGREAMQEDEDDESVIEVVDDEDKSSLLDTEIKTLFKNGIISMRLTLRGILDFQIYEDR